jgi:hypothetical protein
LLIVVATTSSLSDRPTVIWWTPMQLTTSSIRSPAAPPGPGLPERLLGNPGLEMSLGGVAHAVISGDRRGRPWGAGAP